MLDQAYIINAEKCFDRVSFWVLTKTTTKIV